MTSMLGMMGVDESKYDFSSQEKKDFSIILKSIHQLFLKDFHLKEWNEGDGYLVRGDHKIVHFILEEQPDWFFGIWLDDYGDWRESEKLPNTKNEDYYRLQLFAQHSKYIDKFKPSASVLLYEENIYKKEVKKYAKDLQKDSWEKEKLLKLVNYILKYPYLAWYQDVHYNDLKFDYVSLEKAKADYEQSEKERKEHERLQAEAYKKEYDYITSVLDKRGLKYKILDDENCIPRYHVIIEDPTIEKDGWYTFLEDDEEEKLRAIQDSYRSRFYTYSGFDNSARIVKKFKDSK